MRILIISEDPRKVNIGGVPTYTYPLAQRLADRGHDVLYLSSAGYMHDYDWSFVPRWRRTRDGNLERSTLVNAASVGLHPGRAMLDVENRDHRQIVAEVRRFKPDVIHVHSVLGIPIASLEDMSRLAPVIFSCHEYFILCQRGNLITRSGENCKSFPTGSECASCMGQTVSPSRHRARALVRGLPAGIGDAAIRRFESATGVKLEVAPGADADEPPTDSATPSTDAAVRDYERRTAEAVRVLNSACTSIYAVSGSVRDNLALAGVDSDRIEVVHIGSSSAENTPRMPLPSLETGEDPTFIFFGGFNPGKGSKVLMQALQSMESPPTVEWMGPTDLDDEHRAIRASAPKTVTFRGKVDRQGVIDALGRSDVMLAPSVAADTSPQAVLEALSAGRPVIGSRMGGIPDFVEHERNGLLVDAGDTAALTAAMESLRDRAVLRKTAGGVEPPLSVDDHVTDLEHRYSRTAASVVTER